MGGELFAPRRAVVMSRSLLALQAEVVIGVLLVLRHRTLLLAGLLVLILLVSHMIAQSDGAATGSAVWVTLVVAGSLVAVAASRLLAPGANLAAAYRVAAAWWLVPAGRLVGGLAVTLPGVFAVALVVGATSVTAWQLVQLGLLTAGYAASAGALIMAVTPVVGASAAAALGFAVAWFGTVPPSGVSILLERWPLLQGPLVLLWNTLPLSWRAIRWLDRGGLVDPLVIVAWLPLAVATAAWTMTVCYRSQHPRPGSSL